MIKSGSSFFRTQPLSISLVLLMLNSGCLPVVENTGVTTTTGLTNSGATTGSESSTVSSQSGTASQTSNFSVVADTTQAPTTLEGLSGGQQVTNTHVVAEGFLINNGALRTQGEILTLTLIASDLRTQYKLTNNKDCSGGTWQELTTSSLTFTTPKHNDRIDYSIQYSDFDNFPTPCFTQSIIQDNTGPEIIFSKYPTGTLEEGISAEIIYEVNDPLSAITKVQCQIGSSTKDCASGRNVVSLTSLAQGSYTFTINAEDELGNKSTKSITWQVNSTTRSLTQSVTVNDYKKVDILFVIDNSGSMQFEQKSMAQRASNFISVLRGLDWQIAITTTDPRNVALGDGRFIPIYGSNGDYLIRSTLTEDDAQLKLGKTLQRSEVGSGAEQAIRTTSRVIQRSTTSTQPFFRTGAHFAVVVISDEDESANDSLNDPQNLINLVHANFGSQKAFTFHSIITRPGDTVCRAGEGYTYGERYKMLSDLTGGIIGDVCASDYGAQVTGVAEGVRNMLKTLTLQCNPILDRGLGVTITLNGAPFNQSFKVEGVNLVFNQELIVGDYQIKYNCLK